MQAFVIKQGIVLWVVIFTCVPERYAFIGEAAVVPL
jgi:hypothetical protein